MKKLFLTLAILLLSSPAFADVWCQWDGSQGINCQGDGKGYLKLENGLGVSGGEVNYNSHGYFRLTDTEPTIGENQVKGVEIWGKVDNQISRTWSVRDLTTEEIDQREASAMSESEYKLWKAIQTVSGATNQQMADYMGPQLVEAWMARKRLEQ